MMSNDVIGHLRFVESINQSIDRIVHHILINDMTKQVKKVGIIGAGPSGLVQLKNLIETSKLQGAQYELQIKVFESKPDVGGVWYVPYIHWYQADG
jgi:ribulose 1,5-bisphosphate synthetase/thiazole synthase